MPSVADSLAGAAQVSAAAPQLSAIYSYSFKKVSLCLHASSSDDATVGGSRCLQVSQPNLVTVELAADDGQRRTVSLEGLRLEPITCSGLRRQSPSLPGAGVELSVSAVADDDLDSRPADGLGVSTDSERGEAAGLAAAASLLRQSRSLLCGFCSARLADLSAVLEASTSAAGSGADCLHEAAAAYFCHVDHADEKKLVDSGPTSPRSGECRYDGVDLTLPASSILSDAIVRVSRGLVVCARCRSAVGFSTSASAAASCVFFPDLVRLLRDVRDVDDDIVGEEVVSLASAELSANGAVGDVTDDDFHLRRLLRRLGEGEAVRRASLMALSDSGAREVALLWRLDGRCRVYSADIGLVAPDGDVDEKSTATSRVSVCRGRKACRLLYLPSADSAFSGALSQWSRDVSVGSVCLPEQLAMRALLLLAESTGQLAPCFRRVHGFYCGYVPYD